MQNFIAWFKRNNLQISWFIIGWMTLQAIDALARGQYVDAAVALFLAVANFVMSTR